MSEEQNAAPEAVAERIARLMMMRPTSIGPSGNILVPLESDQIAQWCVESAETMGVASGTIARLQEQVAQVERERELLAEFIGHMLARVGHIRPDAPLTGPHLLQFTAEHAEDHVRLADRSRVLTEALEKFGRHDESCNGHDSGGMYPCDCGLSEIISGTAS